MTNPNQDIKGDRKQAEQRFGQENQNQSTGKGGINTGVGETNTQSTREEERLNQGNTFASGEQGRTNTNRDIEGETDLEKSQMGQEDESSRQRKTASGSR